MTATTVEPGPNPTDPAHRPDPYPLYHRLRQEAPCYRFIGPVSGRTFWFLTRGRGAHFRQASGRPFTSR
jgi:hypothetical protein